LAPPPGGRPAATAAASVAGVYAPRPVAAGAFSFLLVTLEDEEELMGRLFPEGDGEGETIPVSTTPPKPPNHKAKGN
jgi:hypothetical protein